MNHVSLGYPKKKTEWWTWGMKGGFVWILRQKMCNLTIIKEDYIYVKIIRGKKEGDNCFVLDKKHSRKEEKKMV